MHSHFQSLRTITVYIGTAYTTKYVFARIYDIPEYFLIYITQLQTEQILE